MLAAMANGLFDVGKLQGVIGAALRFFFFCVPSICGLMCS